MISGVCKSIHVKDDRQNNWLCCSSKWQSENLGGRHMFNGTAVMGFRRRDNQDVYGVDVPATHTYS